MREVRYDGIFDALVEGMANLRIAVDDVMNREIYVSPSMAPHLKKLKSVTLEALTHKEQMVLSVIGDGSDDQEAGERLGLSPLTVNTHRKAIMGKLGLHHKGQVMLYALQQGYVQITPTRVHQPGFERRLRIAAESKAADKKNVREFPSAAECGNWRLALTDERKGPASAQSC